MSFTEQQIRVLARDELRKIIDAGLMYSAGCNEGTPTAKTPSVSSSPQPSATPPTWTPMQPTEKGPWEKTTDINHPEIKTIITEIEKDYKAIIKGEYKYWLSQDKLGVGRNAI